jgi:hypothetical protein
VALSAARELEALRALEQLRAPASASELEKFIRSYPDAPITASRALEAYVGRKQAPNPFRWKLDGLQGEMAKDLRKIVQSHHVLGGILFQEGMSYEELGDLTRARECYDEVIKLDGDSPAARLARERLIRLG